jgi:GxxExxY protein
MDQNTEKLATEVVDAIFAVHREIGPGLLESVYEECLAVELTSRSLNFQRQAAVPVAYRGRQIEVAFRADLIVEDLLLIELKAVEALSPVHKAQAITYLKLLRLPLGLLVNFNVPLIKDGIKRVINSPSP